MTQQGTIYLSPEVEQNLGEQVARQILKESPGDFSCTVCGIPGTTKRGESANVVVLQYLDQQVVKLAHTQCSESTVIPIEQHFKEALLLNESEPTDLVTNAGFLDIPGHGPAALLIAEKERGLSFITATGDGVNPWIAELLAQGWTLAAEPKSWPRPVPRWKLNLDKKQGQGAIFDASKTSFLDQLPPLPSGWAELAIRNKEIIVLSAEGIGLEEHQAFEKDVYSSLEDLAKQGNLVAGRIAVSQVTLPRASQPSQQQKTEQRIAAELKSIMDQRARPGVEDAGGFNDTKDLAPLPARPQLHLTEAAGTQILIVDLVAPREAAQTTETLMQRLQAQGLKPFLDWDSGPFAFPPKDWGYLLWPSQIAIMAGKDSNGSQQKLLFEPLTPVPQWYQAVKSSATNTLGLMIGNLNLPDPRTDPDAFQAEFEQHMADGNVLACILQGMCTV